MAENTVLSPLSPRLRDVDPLATGISFLDSNNPFALINLLPTFMKQAIWDLPLAAYEQSEEELVARHGQRVPRAVNALRVAFWDEYDVCCVSSPPKMMDVTSVAAGTIGLHNLHRMLKDPNLLSWLIHPPLNYDRRNRALHDMGVSEMEAIMDMDHIDHKGRVNTKILELKLKIYQHMDLRIKGEMVRTVNQKTLQVNLAGDLKDAGKLGAGQNLTMEEIQAQLNDLRQKSRALESPGQRMDVVPLKDVRAERERADTIIECEEARHHPPKPVDPDKLP